MQKIGVCDLHFTDDRGRQRIFNGYNVVYKGCETDKDGMIRYRTALTEDVLASLAGQGVNIVRLGVTWAGIEPDMTFYNEHYLRGVRQTVELCEKYGVYVLLDFHQDLYSFYCYNGDGAPGWACKKPDEKRRSKIIWAEGYFFDRSVQTSFDAFWHNEDVCGRGLRDRFCDMVRHTVCYLKGCGNIMGYDVFNEPYPGTPGGRIFRTLVRDLAAALALSRRVDRRAMLRAAAEGRVMDMLSVIDDPVVYRSVLKNSERLLQRFDTECYMPFLTACAEAVRAEDPDGIIFAENSYYSNLGIPCAIHRPVYSDGTAEPNFAFAPHGYDLTVDTPLTNEASPHRVDFIFDEHRRKQLALGVPVLVGEWGGMVPGGERYPALEHLIDKFDANGWSQTYWHFSPEIAAGRIGQIISRPYPAAVAGRITRYGYDRKNDVFFLSYTGDADVKAPTLIYLPKLPKKIYSTRKYRIKEENGARWLQVYAGTGASAVQVEF